jgi:hypothetical protein
MNVDAKEVVYVAEVFHGELVFQRANGGREEAGCIGSEYDVVYTDESVTS